MNMVEWLRWFWNALITANWHRPVVAKHLSLSYTYQGVTFKSNKHMSITNLPKGQSVILTLSGTGKDVTGAVVPAPITGAKVAASEGSLQVVPQPDGTIRLDAVADGGSGTLSITALNSAGTQLAASDSYSTGAVVPAVVADTINLSYSAPFPTPLSAK